MIFHPTLLICAKGDSKRFLKGMPTVPAGEAIRVPIGAIRDSVFFDTGRAKCLPGNYWLVLGIGVKLVLEMPTRVTKTTLRLDGSKAPPLLRDLHPEAIDFKFVGRRCPQAINMGVLAEQSARRAIPKNSGYYIVLERGEPVERNGVGGLFASLFKEMEEMGIYPPPIAKLFYYSIKEPAGGVEVPLDATSILGAPILDSYALPMIVEPSLPTRTAVNSWREAVAIPEGLRGDAIFGPRYFNRTEQSASTFLRIDTYRKPATSAYDWIHVRFDPGEARRSIATGAMPSMREKIDSRPLYQFRPGGPTGEVSMVYRPWQDHPMPPERGFVAIEYGKQMAQTGAAVVRRKRDSSEGPQGWTFVDLLDPASYTSFDPEEWDYAGVCESFPTLKVAEGDLRASR